MIKNRTVLHKRILSAALIFIMSLIFYTHAFSLELTLWEHYSDGYERAFEYARENELPLVIFFHIDGDTWSEKLAENYLTTYEVENFLTDIPKVEINPQIGDAELSISNKFKVKQFPTLFISIPCCMNEPKKVNPFLKDKEMTTEEFLQRIKDVIVGQYSDIGNEYLQNKRYEEAIHHFEMAIEVDPEKAYGYYAIGVVYHTRSAESNDIEYAEKAQEFYKKAFKIEPDHLESIQELERFRQNLDK
ncbi:MAG: tetratricopeptide repeat protein [Deltaproteobacteria bacterium]|nr:tetratricopeptide repeat protein [Deltaproteobacteria bacterium]